MVNWYDQVALFEVTSERFGAVDIVVHSPMLPAFQRSKCIWTLWIPYAGVTEVEMGVCSGDLTVVNDKPNDPKLLALDVNLKGVFYSKQRIGRLLSCDRNDRP